MGGIGCAPIFDREGVRGGREVFDDYVLLRISEGEDVAGLKLGGDGEDFGYSRGVEGFNDAGGYAEGARGEGDGFKLQTVVAE